MVLEVELVKWPNTQSKEVTDPIIDYLLVMIKELTEYFNTMLKFLTVIQ